MVKVLHTSDWHLGQTFFNYDRLDESRHFLNQLAEIVETEQPDVMVVSGDVYNVPSPSASAVKVFTDGMLDVCSLAPQMEVFVTAGNHDSAMRLESDSELWKHHKVHVVGVVATSVDEIRKYVYVVGNKLVVAAVPFFNPRIIETSELFSAIDDEVRRVRTGDMPVVYMAHAAVAGSDVKGHEDGIGGMDFENVEKFGNEYDYLALGHIHCPQTIKESGEKARYCGTPVAVSFDEQYPHGVDIVELERGGVPNVRTVKIEPLRRMRTIPKEAADFDCAIEELARLTDEEDCYVRLNVMVNDFLPSDVTYKVAEAVKGKKCRFCYIKRTWQNQTNEPVEVGRFQINELREMDPVDVACMAWEEINNNKMDEDLLKILKEVVVNERNK